jgi:hypothetical protein
MKMSIGVVAIAATLALTTAGFVSPASAADPAEALPRCTGRPVGAPVIPACARQRYYRHHGYYGPQTYYGRPTPPPVVYQEPEPYYYGPGNGYAPYYEGRAFFYRPYYNTNPFFGFGFRSW